MATAENGDAISETADLNGNITGDLTEGTVDTEMGVVSVRFGELVADASLTTAEKSEWWYDPDDIDGDGNIWKPTMVYPNTVRYNAVVYSYLPLDADMLGLDPVRLPTDGRIPIFRPGDVVVVAQEETAALANPIEADTEYDLGFLFIASCGVTDADAATVDPALYAVDRKLGKITFSWGTWAAPPPMRSTTLCSPAPTTTR